jgi:hypothetical protein
MFGNNLERIKAEAMQELGGNDDAALGQLWNRVYAAFDQWKQEHGNRKPKAYRGMLSDLVGAKSIPFKKAAPWQCADFQVPAGPIALAIKLWPEHYAPFEAITAEAGIRKVLALLIVGFGEDASEDELNDAMRILHDHKTAEAMGKLVLNEHRDAIVAQQTRPDGGRIRGEQQTKEKDDRKQLIKDTEAKLPKGTKPHHVNKEISKAVGVLPDTVGRLRREIKKEASSS